MNKSQVRQQTTIQKRLFFNCIRALRLASLEVHSLTAFLRSLSGGIGGNFWGEGEKVEVNVGDLSMDGVRSRWGEAGARGTNGVPGGAGVMDTSEVGNGEGCEGVLVVKGEAGEVGDSSGEGDLVLFSPRVELNWGVPGPNSKPSASSTGISTGPVIWITGRPGSASNTSSTTSSSSPSRSGKL